MQFVGNMKNGKLNGIGELRTRTYRMKGNFINSVLDGENCDYIFIENNVLNRQTGTFANGEFKSGTNLQSPIYVNPNDSEDTYCYLNNQILRIRYKISLLSCLSTQNTFTTLEQLNIII